MFYSDWLHWLLSYWSAQGRFWRLWIRCCRSRASDWRSNTGRGTRRWTGAAAEASDRRRVWGITACACAALRTPAPRTRTRPASRHQRPATSASARHPVTLPGTEPRSERKRKNNRMSHERIDLLHSAINNQYKPDQHDHVINNYWKDG